MSLMTAVEAGRGVAFLVQVPSIVAGKPLVLRPLKPALPRVPVAVAYRPDGLSAAAAAFLAAARAAALVCHRGKSPVLAR